ncbi:hypothetical protein SDRG_10824 [Saprolegnia diclina VS20]|uniref:Uncharacterized protein n=1 Tax=Saprolegnia diclina (strain VS20) TaxID=1156394 RepID=T0Q1E1_SAPDV|nr:hypothetical protein SDRG_10824 [Saprolegnia diclina VS20]EQC31659.1 hypothetical protein SDRG_10824 [Saprolegnia diclina VS20]|eukprot:XP_008615058.1 hypothetical protein SDRG_10824 [Saprolegnia diclina VS20]
MQNITFSRFDSFDQGVPAAEVALRNTSSASVSLYFYNELTRDSIVCLIDALSTCEGVTISLRPLDDDALEVQTTARHIMRDHGT